MKNNDSNKNDNYSKRFAMIKRKLLLKDVIPNLRDFRQANLRTWTQSKKQHRFVGVDMKNIFRW